MADELLTESGLLRRTYPRGVIDAADSHPPSTSEHLCRTPRCLRLLDVRPGVGGHTPPAADAGSAVISDNQPQSLEGFKFLQDGTVTRPVSSVSRQVYAPSIPVPAPFGDDRQQFDLTIGKRSVTHGASPGWKRSAPEIP